MDKRITELIEYTKSRYDLTKYELHKWELSSRITIQKETIYTLNMEWFPQSIVAWNDDSTNPEGTVYIELDIKSRRVKRLLFSRGRSYAGNLSFNVNRKNDIIQCLEAETGLTYNKRFKILI